MSKYCNVYSLRGRPLQIITRRVSDQIDYGKYRTSFFLNYHGIINVISQITNSQFNITNPNRFNRRCRRKKITVTKSLINFTMQYFIF